MSTTTTPNMPSSQGVPPSTPPDLSAVKAKQQAAWSAGDYAIVGRTLQIVGENLCEAVNLRAGERVLDVAAGNGNATLAAARHFAEVTSTDYVPALLERGRARAEAEGLQVTFREADAEALPFADSTFDVVLSTFGVMFNLNGRQPEGVTLPRLLAGVPAGWGEQRLPFGWASPAAMAPAAV